MEQKEDRRIPRGKVEVFCRECGARYIIGEKELRKRANSCDGYYPCRWCGSNNTTWDFGKLEE